MDLSNLITEDIDDKFCYIQYNEFELIMMKENGYLNATKLCKIGNKEFYKWTRLDGSKELIKELENINKIWRLCNKSSPPDLEGMIIEIKNQSKGKNQYKVAGSYVHQDLIPHICSWISPIFAIKVSKIVNCFMSEKYEFKIKEKEDKIDKLENILNDIKDQNNDLKLQNEKFETKYNQDTQYLKDQNKELLQSNNDLKLKNDKFQEEHKNDIKELKSYYREQRKELKEEFKEQTLQFKETKKELKESNKRLENKIDDLENKLKIKAVINPNKIRKTHKLIILQHKIDLSCFKVLRIQKEREKQEINKYFNKYNIFYNQFEPNPISCFNYLKEHLKRMEYIKNDYNDIELIDLDNYTIENFKQDLDDLNIIRCF